MDIQTVIQHTKISSDSGTEYIYIRNIPFTYDSDNIFYNTIRLDASLHHNLYCGDYVKFNDPSGLCRTIGFKNFYILNQVYKFDPTITTNIKSTLLFSNKSIEDLDILVDAIIHAYNGKIINNNRTNDYVTFRLHNNCCITIYFSYVYDEEQDTNNGYIIEIIHEQTTLYKEQFKAFVADFTTLLED
jgi:hypothetical protein